MQPFVTQLRVRHHEMDALGHVNNAVYQHYLEQAAVEHAESLGFTLARYNSHALKQGVNLTIAVGFSSISVLPVGTTT